MLVKWEKFINKFIDFLSSLPERDQYISEQSRRYWLLKDHMEKLNHVRRAK